MNSKKRNHLSEETSPYLLQHATNPVEWYNWEEGIAKAKFSQKPVLISIGYAACHWCHVMEKESFEDVETAALMNELFINIKIDREERPDLDMSYQTAVARLSAGRGGGWPLTVFATPDGLAFAGGTYFPKESSYGLPGFKQVLKYIHDEYTKNPSKIKDLSQSTKLILEHVYKFESLTKMENHIQNAFDIVLGGMSERFDTIFGGFGSQAPKFPQITDLRMLLVAAQRTLNNNQLINMVIKTVDNLSQGGIYDQLGYGFHRYSTDRKWLVPHFEKMLYDNAQFIVLFLEVYQVTKDKKYLKTVDEIIQYLLREMISPEGLFYSSQDADSDGKEGAFFVWTEEEILNILGKEDGKLFNRYFGVNSDGNFEDGQSILFKTSDLIEDLDKGVIGEEKIDVLKEKLMYQRERRNKPFLNDNVIVAWTSLTFYAFAKASFVLNNNDYLEIAEKGLDFVIKELTDPNSHQISRAYRAGKKGSGFHEDYSLTIQALLEVFSLTGKIEYLNQAVSFQAILDEHFWDSENGGYFFTGSWQNDTYIREKPVITFSVPNANCVSLENLLRLYHYTSQSKYLTQAESLVTFLLSWFMEYNTFEGEALSALHMYQKKPIEFVFLEGKDLSKKDSILDYLQNEFIPNKVLLHVTRDNYKELSGLPMLINRLNSSEKYPNLDSLIYICKDFTCSIPLKTGTEVDLYLNNELK